jgi:hypothetical protein
VALEVALEHALEDLALHGREPGDDLALVQGDIGGDDGFEGGAEPSVNGLAVSGGELLGVDQQGRLGLLEQRGCGWGQLAQFDA